MEFIKLRESMNSIGSELKRI